MLDGQEVKSTFEVKEDNKEEGINSTSLEKDLDPPFEDFLLKIESRLVSLLRELDFLQ